MAVSQQNNRASLLAGLRTGGVRSTSANVPHTAAPHHIFICFADGHAVVRSDALFVQAGAIDGIFDIVESAIAVDIGVRGDVDGAVGCVERDAGASHGWRGRCARGGWGVGRTDTLSR
jgi:hypothetical protein